MGSNQTNLLVNLSRNHDLYGVIFETMFLGKYAQYGREDSTVCGENGVL